MNTFKALIVAALIGLVVFAAFGMLAGLDKLASLYSHINLSFLAFAAVLQAFALLSVFLRWERVVDKTRLRVRKTRLFLISLAGAGFSNLMPSSRMGGEPIRAYFLCKESRKKTGVCISTIISERVFEAVTFILLSLAMLITAFFHWGLSPTAVFLLFLAFLVSCSFLTVVLYVSMNRKVGTALVKKFSGLAARFMKKPAATISRKALKAIEEYSVSLRWTLAHKTLWFYGFFYSGMVWAFDVLRTYFVFLALGFDVPLLVILGAIILSALAGSIPVSPGGLGLVEAGMLGFLLSVGINPAVAVAATILDRLISYWAPTFAGLAASWYLYSTTPKKAKN